MSRFLRPVLRSTVRDLGRTPTNLGWYVGCMALGGGCLYTAPVWTEDVNQAPIIIRPEGDADEPHPIVLFTDLPVVVVAADPEDDPLFFLWETPNGELDSHERQEGEITTSTAIVPYDPELDGQTIDVLVVDQSPAYNDTPVSFLVEIP